MSRQTEFLTVVRPMVDTLRAVADAGQALVTGTQPPDAHSTAMMELHNQDRLVGLVDPIFAAHTSGGILAFAATDHLRNYARLFESEPVAIYSHLVTARSSLDVSSVCAWLSEDGIGYIRRAQRGLVLRLAAAKQNGRAPMPAVKHKATETREKCIAGAAAAGWACDSHWGDNQSPVVGAESLPWPKDAISAVMGGTSGDDRLGPVLWWYLSGVTHGATSALAQAIQEVRDATPVTPLSAGLGTSSQSVVLMGCAVALAYVSAVKARARLFGWTSDGWDAAVAQLGDVWAGMSAAMERQQAPEPLP
jgi:hypothetical protein